MSQDLLHTLALARNGDGSALSRLLAEYTPRLIRMIELRLDPVQRRRFGAEDVVQDALVDVTRRFAGWSAQDRLPFYTWLRMLTAQSLARAQRHHFQTQKREAAREASLERDHTNVSATRAADWLVSTHTSPTQAARRAELRDRVLVALEQLEELDREILALRHFEELTNEEVAAELGIDPAAASKRFARALQRLRPALRALGPDEEAGS